MNISDKGQTLAVWLMNSLYSWKSFCLCRIACR